MAARCRNAIDYTKPVSWLVEDAILNRIEAMDKLALHSIGVTLQKGDDPDGSSSTYYPTKQLKDSLAAGLLPWLYVGNADSTEVQDTSFMSMVNQFKQLSGMVDKVNG